MIDCLGWREKQSGLFEGVVSLNFMVIVLLFLS